MKKVLLLGNSHSVFIKDFCMEVLDKNEVKTTILSKCYSRRYLDSYQRENVSIINWPKALVQGIRKNFSFRHLFEYISGIVKVNWEIALRVGVDVIFVHYVHPFSLLYFYLPWKKAQKRILVFWGSDILQISEENLKLLPLFLRQSTDIIFMIQNQYEYFQEKLGHKYDEKVHVLNFGNGLLNRIDKINSEYNRKQCKKKFGFPEDKIIVHVGYNANTNQQHNKMIKSIVKCTQSSMENELREKLKFVFHISYGQEDNFEIYMNELKSIMDKAFLDYAFVDTYFQDDELAMFRKTCDIFLYGNKTDALSASPLEYIYAGAVFVYPKWLYNNYDELLNEGNILHYVYDDFDELGKVFHKCLKEYVEKAVNDAEFENIDSKGRKIIRDTISWEVLAPKWRSLYE